MTDYYLEDKSRLNGQPKRTIGDYVESQGILVPRRFDTLKEARVSSLPILARTEHEQDYDGVSGLLDSLEFSEVKSSITSDKVRRMMLERDFNVRQYCHLLSLDEETFKQEISFSWWQKVLGYNRSVIADSAVTGRYHIITKSDFHTGLRKHNYTIADVDGRRQSFCGPLAADADNIDELVKLYEQVRTLERFDSQHCPIMEFQTAAGKNYFLQYHRTIDEQHQNFSVERPSQPGEIEALFVRGITPLEGCTYHITFSYPEAERMDNYLAWTLRPEEEASFDSWFMTMFSEIMVRKRKAQFSLNRNIAQFIDNFSTGHLALSKVFKAPLFVAVPPNILHNEREIELLQERALKSKQDQYINLHVLSDGRKAYVKRV